MVALIDIITLAMVLGRHVVFGGTAGECELKIMPRQEWGARPPKDRISMTTPVDTVVIHHTYIPGACHSLPECAAAMRAMQNFHMDNRGWFDIGYSFSIGFDRVFEGRGWKAVGAHAPPFNNHSIGIAFIGDYREELPSEAMLCQCKLLIDYGVEHNLIQQDYQLIGHRQARPTECPGGKLFDLIKTWSHWTPLPIVTSSSHHNKSTLYDSSEDKQNKTHMRLQR